MPESTVNAIITAIGSLLGGIIGAYATIQATKIKLSKSPDDTESKFPLLGIVIGTFIGAVAALAALTLLGLIKITPTPKLDETVTINANVRWVDSGVIIRKGDLVDISYVSGQWRPGGADGVNTNGWDCNSNTPYTEGLLPTAPGKSLIAKIENNPPFCVGASPAFVSQYSGILYFSFNDCESSGCFSDNIGSLNVKVVVTSK